MIDEFPLGYRNDLENVLHLAETQRTTDAADLFSASLDRPIDESVRAELKEQVIVEGQARTSSCVGHAGSSVAELNGRLETGIWEQLSRWGAYITAQKESGIDGDNGAHIDGMCRGGQKVGIGRETLWQFTGKYHTKAPDPAAYAADAAKRRFESWKLMRSYADMAVWSQTGQGGFVIGVPWYTNWLNGVKGIMPPPNGKLYGWHAYPLFWLTKRTEGSRNYLEGPNSWLKTWSVNGWAEWAPSLMDWLFKRRGVVICGVSDLTNENRRVRSVDWKGDSPWKRKG